MAAVEGVEQHLPNDFAQGRRQHYGVDDQQPLLQTSYPQPIVGGSSLRLYQAAYPVATGHRVLASSALGSKYVRCRPRIVSERRSFVYPAGGAADESTEDRLEDYPRNV